MFYVHEFVNIFNFHDMNKIHNLKDFNNTYDLIHGDAEKSLKITAHELYQNQKNKTKQKNKKTKNTKKKLDRYNSLGPTSINFTRYEGITI